MQIILNARDTTLLLLFTILYGNISIFAPAWCKDLTHIYHISVSIKIMLISRLKRFLGVKFMFPPQFNVQSCIYFSFLCCSDLHHTNISITRCAIDAITLAASVTWKFITATVTSLQCYVNNTLAALDEPPSPNSGLYWIYLKLRTF